MPRRITALLLALSFVTGVSAQSERASPSLRDLATPATVPDYTARVPLADNTASARDKALAEALDLVFQRASGGAALPSFYRGRGRDWVQNFNLDRDNEGLGLRATFDAKSIDDAVVQSGLPLWGRVSGATDTVRITFGNVSSAERYAQLMQALSRDRRIDKLQIESQYADELTLRLTAEGGERTVDELMASNGLADSRGMTPERTLRFDLR